MAIRQDFTADDEIFRGSDKILEFEVFDEDEVAPIDVSGWSLEWVLRYRSQSVATLQKTTGGGGITVVGVFNADPNVNTQRVRVAIADIDTDALQPDSYRHALRRTDDGSEDVLSFGEFVLMSSAAV